MNTRTLGWSVTILAAVAATLTAAPSSAAQTLLVDDDHQECGPDTYSTITQAIEVAMDGDVILVCPGKYSGPVVVSKSISIIGPMAAIEAVDCFAAAPALPDDLDLASFAVLSPEVPTTEATDSLVTLDADNIELAGLVIQGVIDRSNAWDSTNTYPLYTPALTTTATHAGYRIHDNLIRLNTLGVELGSSGAITTSFAENCLRENRWGVANQRRQLHVADISGNASFRTQQISYEIGWGLAGASKVTVLDNKSAEDFTGYRVENAADVRVGGNLVSAAFNRGIDVVGGNLRLEIDGNVIAGGITFGGNPVGIFFSVPTLQVPARTSGVQVHDNSVSGIRNAAGVGTGIGVAIGAVNGAEFFDNITTDNGSAGLSILNRNSANMVYDNVSLRNLGYGIRVQGAGSIGNAFQDNRMEANGIADARDDTDPTPTDGVVNLQSIWLDNECTTDIPAGAICGTN